MKHIFEISSPGRKGIDAGNPSPDTINKLDGRLLRKSGTKLPEVSELDAIRHYVKLSQLNFSVDTHFYPLGSCTMKYNPKINEATCSMPGFTESHPFLAYINEKSVQGALEIIYNLSQTLCEVTGMKKFTTQPYAGAHGELTGILLIAAYHKNKRNKKRYIVVPESAHGTNPASAAMGGYSVISIPVDRDGRMDIDIFSEKMSDEVAGVMLTLPNTLGLFH